MPANVMRRPPVNRCGSLARDCAWNHARRCGISYGSIVGVRPQECRSACQRTRPSTARETAKPPAAAMAKRLGLRYVTRDALTIRRRASRQGLALSSTPPGASSAIPRSCAASPGSPCRRPTSPCSTPPTRPRICKRWAATPPGGCNTATIRTGKRCASSARRAVLRVWRKACRASAGASGSISPAPSRRVSWRSPPSSSS